VSPILTRPVREQLDHDRVIRLLQARYKRKNEAKHIPLVRRIVALILKWTGLHKCIEQSTYFQKLNEKR
jgi:hypothetical protein